MTKSANIMSITPVPNSGMHYRAYSHLKDSIHRSPRHLPMLFPFIRMILQGPSSTIHLQAWFCPFSQKARSKHRAKQARGPQVIETGLFSRFSQVPNVNGQKSYRFFDSSSSLFLAVTAAKLLLDSFSSEFIACSPSFAALSLCSLCMCGKTTSKIQCVILKT